MGHACLLSIQSVLCPAQIPLLLSLVPSPFSLVLYLFVFVLVLFPLGKLNLLCADILVLGP